MPRIVGIGAALAAIGLALLFGGIVLIGAGGSLYYAGAGVAVRTRPQLRSGAKNDLSSAALS